MHPTQAAYPMKQRSPWGVWLLAIVTFGIYFYVWYYKIHREMLDRFPDQQINPAGSLLTILLGWLLILPPLVSIANTGGRIAKAEYAVGARVTASGGLGLLLWVLAGLAMPYYQAKLNTVIDTDRRRDHSPTQRVP